MLLRCVSPMFTYGKFVQNNLPVLVAAINSPNFTQVAQIAKHWNPKWKKERRQKVIKIKLPSFEEKDDDPTKLDKEEIRSRMKEHGFLPQKPWNERPAYISSTSTIFESYVAPEGDGKYSAITKEGAKQKFTFLEKKSKSLMAVRKIKSFDDSFSTAYFLEEALDIYQKAHEALAAKNEDEIIKYVTEMAYPKITHNMTDKTIHWKFLESLEPARLVHARTTSVLTKDNIFAQLTVRFHTQQVLAIYDRFGRLIQGSEILRKDVLEYIVFEKHLANEYGVWRIHGKIIPSWMAPTDIAEGTYVLPKEKHDPVPTEPHPVEATLTEDTPKDVTSAQSS
ncbi:probable 39S ribosomal protein L45, mitochondrial [Temnothorax curvispinosus]|uniref:Large ribosomal subunit protein mL45 n=1 Tax=Temnothorax curvispinosus TaxID=300111 RepID=A0A6J1R7X1_9HYME|nr:probable 39S ribosomal protein L45, mitochondrial [Temnothorax curvispinosus]XP_024889035.1 probable 39S ribosomal protein L45, mitochondrial [Temnothorax curvispinosus]XP_024889036.1 probable 39S ribosomal protein L45, mitochondrial [Temnothorax curvispinosus]XP_024889037.1 probable 39S ribosomal protein L45, mitochondrial [Temnothorax curvispinosus]